MGSTSWLFPAAVLGGSFAAGVVGAVLGLGGGIIVIPLLTLAMHVPIRYAMGASVVSIIATSSGAAAAYVRDRLTNIRIGMLLEVFTTTGAIAGAFLAGLVSTAVLYVVFGLMLAYSALALFQNRNVEVPEVSREDPLAARLGLRGTYYDVALGRSVEYRVASLPPATAMMFLAGVLSGLLGIGSGLFKVLAMDQFMRLPMKVSTATSNFMIGVTAAASAGVYFSRGYIRPEVAAPVALGVLAGAALGTRLMVKLRNTQLRKLFLPVLVAVALEMILRGVAAR